MIDFLDLDGETVVWPFRYEVRNVDLLVNRTEVGHIDIYTFIDGALHGHGQSIASWQKRVVGWAPVDLVEGEYTIILRAADAESTQGDMVLFDLESPPRTVRVAGRRRAPLYETREGFLRPTNPAACLAAGSGVEGVGPVVLTLQSAVGELSRLPTAVASWAGPVSVAVYLSGVDQADLSRALGRVREAHAAAERAGADCLTVSLLLAPTASSSDLHSSGHGAGRSGRGATSHGGAEYPWKDLLGLAMKAWPTASLAIVAGLDALPSMELVDASADQAWATGLLSAAGERTGLVVPLFDLSCRDGPDGWGGSSCCVGRGAGDDASVLAGDDRDGDPIGSRTRDGDRCNLKELQRLHALGAVRAPRYLDGRLDEWLSASEAVVAGASASAGVSILEMDYEPHLSAHLFARLRRLGELAQRVDDQAKGGGGGGKGGRQSLLEDLCYGWSAGGGRFALLPAFFFYRPSWPPPPLAPALLSPDSARSAEDLASLAQLLAVGNGDSDGVDGFCQVGGGYGGGGAWVPGADDCVINLYGPLPVFYQGLLGRAVRQCGCHFKVIDQPCSVGCSGGQEEYYRPGSLVVLSIGITHDAWVGAEEAYAILLRMARPDAPLAAAAALERIGVVYLGDELMRFAIDPSLHTRLAFAFHQSWRPDFEGSGLADHTYLLDPPVRPTGLYWLPLGCWEAFHPRAVFGIRMAGRRYLWSWAGSVNGKPDRGEMLDALQQHPRWPELRARGHVTLLADWNDSQGQDPSLYKGLMYETQYVPCSRGTHPETYRMWEALEAGAIPVLLRCPEQALVETVLGPGLVWIASWDELPVFLLGVTPQETERRSSLARSRYALVRQSLATHFARAVCLLRPPVANTAVAVFRLTEGSAGSSSGGWRCGGPDEFDGSEVGLDGYTISSDAIASSAAFSDVDHGVAAATAADAGAECLINLYGSLPLFFQTLLGVMARECGGCHFKARPHPREEDQDYLPGSLVILDAAPARDPWAAGGERGYAVLLRMSRSPTAAAALGRIGVMYLGDELQRFVIDPSLHARLAFAFHQSWRPDLEGSGLADHTYLLEPPPRPAGIYWLPRGCNEAFHPRAVFGIAVGRRRYLWSWVAGGGGGGPQGGEMLESMRRHPRWEELHARGRVEELAGADSVAYTPPGSTRVMADSSLHRAILYETQYAPCPAGPRHPETPRVWEALEAGAVPIVLRAPEFAEVEALGLGIVWLDDWAELAEFLLSASPEETDRRSQHSRARYAAVRRALGTHLARAVCSLASGRPSEKLPAQ